MKLFVTGAAGNSGRRIVRMALARGHAVTAQARTEAKLRSAVGDAPIDALTVSTVDLSDQSALAAAMAGHDVVINAAGNISDGASYAPLVQGVIRAAEAALGAGGRLWIFGGAAALDAPGGGLTLDLPRVPAIFRAHGANLEALRATTLDWSMLCPGPMIDAPDGKPTPNLRLSADIWPVPAPALARVLPRIAQSLAFRNAMPQMTIFYEDAAATILGHLDRNGPFSRKRVGVALPPGMTRTKMQIPR
jgi:hypothetical protein